MHRPLGITILAVLAGLAGLFQVWRILVFLGITSFSFVGKTVSFSDPQWGYAIWAAILAAIWFWVAAGFWGVRAYAWSFGNFIALFTIIFGFFALLGGSTMEAETVGWLLAIVVYMYLNYPGVRDAFYQSEVGRLTPEQKAAMEQMEAAQRAMAQATAAISAVPAAAAPAAAAPAAAAPAAPAPPPAPTDPGPTGS